MDEITFEDVLTHYRLKLKEVSDEVEILKNQIKKAEGHIDAGWSGATANACRLKLEVVNGELVKTLAEITEALIKLSAIGELLAEDDPTLI
ncbi:MAG: hypothetical protein J6Q89_02475 [Clostridia bacterium]|nr:hypothetical protein [Clostridia bacterium]